MTGLTACRGAAYALTMRSVLTLWTGVFAAAIWGFPLAVVAAQEDAEVVRMPTEGDIADRAGELDGMRTVLAKALQLVKDARDNRDVVMLNCLNEKLTPIKGLLRISEQAHITLQEAAAKGEVESAHHENEKITIAAQKTQQLLGESEACVGALSVYTGNTELEVEMPEDADDIPQTELPMMVFIQRPPAASPFQ